MIFVFFDLKYRQKADLERLVCFAASFMVTSSLWMFKAYSSTLCIFKLSFMFIPLTVETDTGWSSLEQDSKPNISFRPVNFLVLPHSKISNKMVFIFSLVSPTIIKPFIDKESTCFISIISGLLKKCLPKKSSKN